MPERETFSSIVEVITFKEIDFLDFLYDSIREETRDLFLDKPLIFTRGRPCENISDFCMRYIRETSYVAHEVC